MREKLIESLKLSPACICDLCGEEGALDRVAGVIADNLIDDGVTIPVRCGECIHYDFGVCLKIYSDGAVSQYAWQARNEDDFCSYGERRTDG